NPVGSILSGDNPHSYKVEGIGEDFIPKAFNRQLVDEMIRVNDKESFNIARRLAREEGILAGGSAGTALAAALKYAQRLEQPKFIVVLLPDTGRNYLSKIFSDVWMRDNDFWEGATAKRVEVRDILSAKQELPALISLNPKDNLNTAVKVMHAYGISQLPVIDNGQLVGSLDEASLMKFSHDSIDFDRQEIGPMMGKALPAVDEETEIGEAYRVLLSGSTGIIITKSGYPLGVLTRTDLINYWISQKE
ncbi:MAG: pyridoxal-phosphate dependent enzyme, partial [bacterium]|nr:pyridoxal-phosphate dependent enzyme [bacterium]